MSASLPSVIIRGTGAYAPPKVLSNKDLAKMVDTSDEWIRSRTGIAQRRIAEAETTSQMAIKAAQQALANAKLSATEIDLVIVGTITPDMPFPSTAALVQTALGIPAVPCFDLEAACSGFLYTLEVATHMLRSGNYRNVLVIGAEKMSSIIDWEDRNTCVLFGDGAGAAILSKADTPQRGLLGSLLGADGARSDLLCLPGGGSACPPTHASIEQRKHFLKMNGQEIFKAAVRLMEQATLGILEQHQLKANDIACIIPHQANIRIFETLAQRLNLPLDRFFMNLQSYGNTSAASIPMALHEAREQGRLKSGELTLLVAFGGGLTWGASLIRWQ